MANERYMLNIGSTTKDSSVKNILCEGNVDVTDDGASAVHIGDTVQGVDAENVTFRGNISLRNLSNTNVEPTSYQWDNSVQPHVVQKAMSAACSVSIGSTNQNVKANKLINNTTVNVNVNTQSIPETIRFQVEEPEDNFTGRSRELDQLKQIFAGNVQTIAVCAMGGVGKTQLARAFINLNRSQYKVVIWIHSDEIKSIDQSFFDLCRCELRLSTEDANGREMEPMSVITTVLRVLCERETLFIYDNVDSAASTDYVKRILAIAPTASAEKPHVLITSRHQEWPPQVKTFALRVWSETQSVEYITKILNDCPGDSENDKRSLAETLQYFPLALRQATAYIKLLRGRDPSLKISQFIAKFSRKTGELLNDTSFKKQMMSVYGKTTYTTWLVTMDEIQRDQSNGALAIRILKIIAYCDADRIPAEFFHCVSNGESQLIDEDEEKWKERIDSAIDLLVNYCMVDRFSNWSQLSVHRLVQEVVKLLLTESGKVEETLRDALQLLTDLVARGSYRQFLTNLNVESIFDSLLSSSVKENLIREFSSLPVTIIRNLMMEEDYYKLDEDSVLNKFFYQMTNVLGPSNRHVLKFRYYMAAPSSDIVELRDIYEKQCVHLPEKDSDTLETQCRIACYHITWGEIDKAANWLKQTKCRADISNEAITMLDEYRGREFIDCFSLRLYQISFDLQTKLLGETHSDAILIVPTIADLHKVAGNGELSFTWFKKSFEILCREKKQDKTTRFFRYALCANLSYSETPECGYTPLRLNQFIFNEQKNSFGYNHSDTLNSLFRLADAHSNLGNYNAAVPLYEIVFEKQKQGLFKIERLGSVHVLYRISNTYTQLKDWDSALQWYRIAIDREIADGLSEDNPSNLERKDYDVKLRSWRQTFLELRIALDKSFPETIPPMCRIARTYIDLRKIYQGLEWYQRALDIQTIYFGEAHLETLNTMCQIARIHNEYTSNDAALEWYRKVIDQLIESVSSMDEINWDLINDEADFYFHNEYYSLALQLYEILFAKQKEVLGAEDTRTVRSFSMLTKQRHGALKLLQDKLEDQRNSDEHHKDTATTMSRIADIYSDLRQGDLALQWYQDVLNCLNGLANQQYQNVFDWQPVLNEWKNDRVRETICKIIRTHVRLGNFDDAVGIYRSALDVASECIDHSTWTEFHAEASFQFNEGNYDLADLFYELILEKQMFWLDADHSTILKTMNEIACTKNKLRRYIEALTTYRDVFERRKICIGEFHPDTLETMAHLAHLNQELGNGINAQKLYRKLYAILRYLKGDEHPGTRSAFRQCDLKQQDASETYLPECLREELAIRKHYVAESRN